MHLLLVATQTVFPREFGLARIALGTHGRVAGALGPRPVILPHVTLYLLPVSGVNPGAILLGTATVSGGVIP
jgi:hypothetical protein